MAQTIAYRQLAPALGLSVGVASHAAVQMPVPVDGTVSDYVLLENTSATLTVWVTLTPGLAATGIASTVPGDGTTGGQITLLPLQSKIVNAPAMNNAFAASNGYSITAISTAAGPSLITATIVAPV